VEAEDLHRAQQAAQAAAGQLALPFSFSDWPAP
jgi:phage/plasmid primase-like uncharacterized protein